MCACAEELVSSSPHAHHRRGSSNLRRRAAGDGDITGRTSLSPDVIELAVPFALFFANSRLPRSS